MIMEQIAAMYKQFVQITHISRTFIRRKKNIKKSNNLTPTAMRKSQMPWNIECDRKAIFGEERQRKN